MIWFILTLFVTTGVSLIIMGYTAFNFLSPLTSINIVGIIVLISIWTGYRHWLSSRYKEIFAYLRVLYDDVGLFVQGYYNSVPSVNREKSTNLQVKMGKFVPLLSRYEQSLPNKYLVEINNFFDKLFYYKRRIEGAISYNRDETAYRRWCEIDTDYSTQVTPAMKKIKKILN